MLSSTMAVLRAALRHDESRNSEDRIDAADLGSVVDETNPATAGIAQVIAMLPCCQNSCRMRVQLSSLF